VHKARYQFDIVHFINELINYKTSILKIASFVVNLADRLFCDDRW
jgi:hypothetical protein